VLGLFPHFSEVVVGLMGIIINLLLVGSYFDIALRDFGLFLAALALFRLAMSFHSVPQGQKPAAG